MHVFTLLLLLLLIGCEQPTSVHPHPVPDMQPSPSPSPLQPPFSAWSWEGTTAHAFVPDVDQQLPTRPDRLPADLRGTGQLLWATRSAEGIVTVRDGETVDAPLVWRNEADTWSIPRIDVGDPNDDGRIEYVLLLWKPDDTGALRSHPFLMGWRSGYYRIIWGGSATSLPIQDIATADLDRDGRFELVVLEGGTQPGDAGEYVSVWHWHGWGFQKEWQSSPGQWHTITLYDIHGDETLDIVAQ